MELTNFAAVGNSVQSQARPVLGLAGGKPQPVLEKSWWPLLFAASLQHLTTSFIRHSIRFYSRAKMSASDNYRPGGGPRKSKSSRRSRKGKGKKKMALTQDDIDFLKQNTKYDEAEIREWYKGFKVTIFNCGSVTHALSLPCNLRRWTARTVSWERTRSRTSTLQFCQLATLKCSSTRSSGSSTRTATA